MCTGIRLKADNGAIVCARTLEFGQNIESKILMIPQNFEFQGTAPSGKPEGLRWKSKYSALGANAAGQIGLIDGVNEKGLAGGLFYFTGYAQYQDVPQNQMANSIAPWEIMTWILTSCQSVQEVKDLLPKIYVSSAIFTAWDIIPPVHAVVHDVQGNSLVIEYVQGKLNMYDNPLGVITNSPTFDWHITNLNNYVVNMNAANVQELQLKGAKLTAFGQGSGMLGLPGDFTPPSRFVRAVFYSQNIIDIKNEKDAVHGAFHILNLFDIPKGCIRAQENGATHYDHTQWTSVSDLKNMRYYYRTYENQEVKMVDLMALKKDGTEIISMPMD